LTGDDTYTPENDLNLTENLSSPDDTYTPENDLNLTDDLRTGLPNTFDTVAGSASYITVESTLDGSTTVELETASASYATIDSLVTGTTTADSDTSDYIYTPEDSLVTGTTTIETDAQDYVYNGGNIGAVPTIPTETGTAVYSGENIFSTTFTLQTGSAEYTPVASSLETLGNAGEVTVLIEGERIDTFTNIEIERRLNEVDTFAFEAFITDDNDRALINEGNDVKIIEDFGNLLFKGRLTEVEYQSNFRAKCEGDGMEVKLLNRKTERETFNNNGDDIVKNVVDQSTISYGDIEVAPQVNVRFDHDNKARAVAGVANATGYDWYVDQEAGDNFDTDYLNFVADAGRDTVQETFDIGGNARMVKRDKDESFVANDITLLGRGDGINQLEANVFAATTKYTETDGVITESETGTFNVNDAFSMIDAGFDLSNTNSTGTSITGQSEGTISDIKFNGDGSKIYEIESSTIYEYNLSTNYDLSTATYTGNTQTLSFNTEAAVFGPNGETAYFTSRTFDRVRKFDLQQAYDLLTITNEEVVFSLSASSPSGIEFGKDGKIFLESDFLNDQIIVHQLDTAYDLSTVSSSNTVFLNVVGSGEIESPNDIGFSGDGSKFYVGEFDTRLVEFNLSTDYDITTRNYSTDISTSTGNDVQFDFNDSGTELLVAGGSTISSYTNSGPYDDLIVRVGSERMNVTVQDSTTMAINSRGLDDYEGEPTNQIKHLDNIRVWLVENLTTGEGPYTPENKSTAQTGSSIDTFGVKEQRATDKTIVDISTLEKTADLELKNRFEDVFRIQIDTSEPRVTEDLRLGDPVVVQDTTAMDVDDNFEVVGFDVKRSSSEEGTVLHLANRPRRLTERLSDIESDRNTLNAHMQGATNLAPINFRDNADNSNPLIADLFVPEDAVAVNKVDVKAKRQPFRGFVKANATSGSSDTGEYLNSGRLSPTGNTILSPPHTINVDVVSSPTGQDAGVNVSATVSNFSGSGKTYDFEVRNTTTSTTLDTESNVDVLNNSFKTFNYSYDSDEVSSGDDLKLTVDDDDLATQNDPSLASYIEFGVSSKSVHEHSLLGEQDFGIFQPDTEPDIDIDLVVDGNTVQTFTDVSVGDEVGPIDVNTSLTDPVAGAYHEIKLVPKDIGGGNNGRCRLTTDVNGKIFIESTL